MSIHSMRQVRRIRAPHPSSSARGFGRPGSIRREPALPWPSLRPPTPHADELFLTLRVREAAPVVHLAKLADARRDFFLQRSQLGGGVFHLAGDFAPGRIDFLETAADVPHQPIALAERDRVGFGGAAGALGQPVQLADDVLLRFDGSLALRHFARGKRLLDS